MAVKIIFFQDTKSLTTIENLKIIKIMKLCVKFQRRRRRMIHIYFFPQESKVSNALYSCYPKYLNS